MKVKLPEDFTLDGTLIPAGTIVEINARKEEVAEEVAEETKDAIEEQEQEQEQETVETSIEGELQAVLDSLNISADEEERLLKAVYENTKGTFKAEGDKCFYAYEFSVPDYDEIVKEAINRKVDVHSLLQSFVTDDDFSGIVEKAIENVSRAYVSEFKATPVIEGTRLKLDADVFMEFEVKNADVVNDKGYKSAKEAVETEGLEKFIGPKVDLSAIEAVLNGINETFSDIEFWGNVFEEGLK